MSLGSLLGPSSYVERPGWQGIFCAHPRRTVQSYVRPFDAVMTAGHDEVRDPDRLITLTRLTAH